MSADNTSDKSPRGKKSEELLVHFQCGACRHWWSIGDAPEQDYFCPWCGIKQTFE